MGRKSRFRLVEDIFQANAESVLAFIESANVLERRMMPVADSSKCFPTCDEFAFQFDISFDEARAVGRDPEAFQFDSRMSSFTYSRTTTSPNGTGLSTVVAQSTGIDGAASGNRPARSVR